MFPQLPQMPVPGPVGVSGGGTSYNPNPGVLPYKPNAAASAVGSLVGLVNAARAHEKAKEQDNLQKGMNMVQLMQQGIVPWSMAPVAFKHLVRGKYLDASMLTGPTEEEMATQHMLTQAQNAGAGGQVSAPNGLASGTGSPDAPSQLPVNWGQSNAPSMMQPPQPQQSLLQRLGQRMGVTGPQIPGGMSPSMNPNSPMALIAQRMQAGSDMQRQLAMMDARAQAAGSNAKEHIFNTLADGISHGNDPEWAATHPVQTQALDHTFGEPSNYRIGQHMVSQGKVSEDDFDRMFLQKAFGLPNLQNMIYENASKNVDRFGGDLGKALRFTAASLGPQGAKLMGISPDQAEQIVNDPDNRPQMTVPERLDTWKHITDTIGSMRVPTQYQGLMNQAAIGAAQGSQSAMQVLNKGMMAFGRANDEYTLRTNAQALDVQKFKQSLNEFDFNTAKAVYETTQDSNRDDWSLISSGKGTKQELDAAIDRIKSNRDLQRQIVLPYTNPITGQKTGVPTRLGELDSDRYFNILGPSNMFSGRKSIINGDDAGAQQMYDQYKKRSKGEGQSDSLMQDILKGVVAPFSGPNQVNPSAGHVKFGSTQYSGSQVPDDSTIDQTAPEGPSN